MILWIHFDSWFWLGIWSCLWFHLFLWHASCNFLCLTLFIHYIDSLCFRFLYLLWIWLCLSFNISLLLNTSDNFCLITFCCYLFICLRFANWLHILLCFWIERRFLNWFLLCSILSCSFKHSIWLLDVRVGLNSFDLCWLSIFAFIPETHFQFRSQSFQIRNT